MGIAAVNGQLLMVVAFKNDLEYRMMQISNERLALAYQSGAMQDGDPGKAPDAATQEKDKALEMELKNLETQEKAVTAEYDDLRKLLDENIKVAFKNFS